MANNSISESITHKGCIHRLINQTKCGTDRRNGQTVGPLCQQDNGSNELFYWWSTNSRAATKASQQPPADSEESTTRKPLQCTNEDHIEKNTQRNAILCGPQ